MADDEPMTWHTLSLRRTPAGKLGVDEAIALGENEGIDIALRASGTGLFRCQVEGQSFLDSCVHEGSLKNISTGKSYSKD